MSEQMLEQQKQTQPVAEEPAQDNQHYIDAIRELKANSVSIDKYEKLETENRNLLNSLINGEQLAAAESSQEKKSLDELRNELFRPKKELSNLEYVEKALELRERVMEETGEDCFVSSGHNITPTAESYANAQKVADIYRECIDYANGDSAVFTNELMRYMQDNPIVNKIRR